MTSFKSKRFRIGLMAVRLFRAGLLVAVLMVLRFHGGSSENTAITIDAVRPFFPGAVALRPGENLFTVVGPEDAVLGFALKTLPQSREIVGYAGPSDVLVALDLDGAVIGTRLLWSGDTREHADAVREKPAFFESFSGWTLGNANPVTAIDAVSGATLTSLAIVESVAVRLGGERPSLKFPDAIALADVQRLFPAAVSMGEPEADGVAVHGIDGALLGRMIRTSPQSDNVAGYQGPSEGLLGLLPDGRVQAITLGRTYDNQRYADYVREDTYFTQRHRGKTLAEIAAMNVDQAWADGVSGATMTSGAVMEAVIHRAQMLLNPPAVVEARSPAFQFRWRDGITALAILFGCAIAFTWLRARPAVRIALHIYLIAALGLWVGDMVSLAVLGGWAQGAVPWKSAPGLVAMAAAAFAIPWGTGRPVYCQQICPHGAAQALLFRVVPWRIRVPRPLHRALVTVPLVILTAGVAIAAMGLSVGLSALEPFDAWIFGVGGIASILIAVVGLAASTVVPQAYCKYGCPTGLVLEYARARGNDSTLTRRDAWAVGLLVLAIGLRLIVA